MRSTTTSQEELKGKLHIYSHGFDELADGETLRSGKVYAVVGIIIPEVTSPISVSSPPPTLSNIQADSSLEITVLDAAEDPPVPPKCQRAKHENTSFTQEIISSSGRITHLPHSLRNYPAVLLKVPPCKGARCGTQKPGQYIVHAKCANCSFEPLVFSTNVHRSKSRQTGKRRYSSTGAVSTSPTPGQSQPVLFPVPTGLAGAPQNIGFQLHPQPIRTALTNLPTGQPIHLSTGAPSLSFALPQPPEFQQTTFPSGGVGLGFSQQQEFGESEFPSQTTSTTSPTTQQGEEHGEVDQFFADDDDD